MKIEYVNPFVDATVETFQTMCSSKPKRDGKLDLKEAGSICVYDLVGVIGLTGGVRGAVMMTMGVDTGRQAVGAFMMGEMPESNVDLMDGFGELLNIVAGAAAAKLSGLNVQLALPTVVIGKEQQLHTKHGNPWVVIPLKFPEWGKFNIELSMEEL